MKMNHPIAYFLLLPVVAIAGLVTAFPHFSRAKVSGKPSRAVQAQAQDAEMRRKQRFVEPVMSAIKDRRTKDVKKLWEQSASTGYREDPWLRLQSARYFAQVGEDALATDHLEMILNPPRGNGSTLQTSGEVMSLWLKVARPSPQVKLSALEKWAARRNAQPHGAFKLKTSDAEWFVEYLAGQEAMAQDKPGEALPHLERAVGVAPNSSFAWRQLGLARERAGDFPGSKAAMIRSYFLAPPEEQEALMRRNRLKKSDIKQPAP